MYLRTLRLLTLCSAIYLACCKTREPHTLPNFRQKRAIHDLASLLDSAESDVGNNSADIDLSPEYMDLDEVYPDLRQPYEFDVYKRVPVGFFGMRGKRDIGLPRYDPVIKPTDKSANDFDNFYKRIPMGFFGVRGKRVPMGFVGMRGKKFYDKPAFFAMRGKRYPYQLPATSYEREYNNGGRNNVEAGRGWYRQY